MDSLTIRECSIDDLDSIKFIGEKTFHETFSVDNTAEDITDYLNENFSLIQLTKEIRDHGSKFFIVENGKDVIAYMKLNFDVSQTETGHANTLEVQRIYVVQDYKGMKIGQKLIQTAIEIGQNNNLSYIWLGVWENNFNAINFYERLGFSKFDTHIFKLGEDEQTDYLMKLPL